MNELDKSKHAGNFKILPDREMPGNLSVDGPDSFVYIWDEKFIDVKKFEKTADNFFTGILDDSRKVSLIDCIVHPPGFHLSPGGQMHHLYVSPHYIIVGDQYVSDSDETIVESRFVVDDAEALFDDRKTFGSIFDSHSIMQQIIETEKSLHDVVIGEHPVVAYFTGKTEIFSSHTVFGKISAHHSPSVNWGGPKGVNIENKISIHMKFERPISFREVVNRVWRVLRFLELMIGRSQNLVEFKICKDIKQKRPQFLEVYDCMYPKYERNTKLRFTDILIDAVRNPTDFSQVFAAWLERDDKWRDARSRLSSSLKEENTYGIDRLIRNANMFDLLPEKTFPVPPELPQELLDARDRAKDMFESLPVSPERNSVLGALGRVGKWTLKRKIRQRVDLLLPAIDRVVPDLSLVTDEAVNCRNHYVHGSDSRVDYNEEFDTQVFLTNTLEFVFAASDLIESGWDIASWCQTGPHLSHPFGQYIYSYSENIEKLKSLLAIP